ncbi:uncharacterized protein TRIADDRAFT_20604 [Trichoplax adhaerens]|uniref:Ubiquinone biosynthesis protein COQ4 homolog, mitochondrial n=1 Tax=Trichoplax adhaerens TaxID=10228 RepID=B3RNI2_TRIAD|nr:hypothetical protein TRIADDRAFT_20604 [Trichoplax adhaerens]EDV27459.1 hypothetical protein TRIADDRAFT_20604 [Trichoplax adhaerens]|eukprot:XP_002109293.1 hypothetical protein TRIADDRAFT_20604 [Trichoplax adhaerens]
MIANVASGLGYQHESHQDDAESSINQETDTRKVLYNQHIPTTNFQRAALAFGSAFAALNDPRRHVMVADLGEATGQFALERLRSKMNADPSGRQILRERPRIHSSVVNLDKLRNFPEDSFGKAYVQFLDTNEITPDSRMPVRFVDDEELAYVMTRYREIHDFVHTLLGLSISVPNEIIVKWFEMIQTGLPMCMLGSFFGPLKLSLGDNFILTRYYIPWVVNTARKAKSVMNVYFEKQFDRPIETLRQELNITIPPNVPFEGKYI